MQETLPAGRPILLGIYATGHSCDPVGGTPSNRYVYDLARLATNNPGSGVGGAMACH